MTEEQATTIVGGATSLGRAVIASLPAQFLMLCVLNLIFVGVMFWFLDQQQRGRERLLSPIITRCLEEVPTQALTDLIKALQSKEAR